LLNEINIGLRRNGERTVESEVAKHIFWAGRGEILSILRYRTGSCMVIDEQGVNVIEDRGRDRKISTGICGAVCASQDESVIVVGLSFGGLVRIFDISSAVYTDHAFIDRCILAPEGEMLNNFDGRVCEVDLKGSVGIGCYGCNATIFDLQDNSANVYLVSSQRLTCVALSREQFAVTASIDGTSTSWDKVTGQKLITFERHQSAVYALAITAGGRKAVSGSGGYHSLAWTIVGEHPTADNRAKL
jgi:WD40 repeat protein